MNGSMQKYHWIIREIDHVDGNKDNVSEFYGDRIEANTKILDMATKLASMLPNSPTIETTGLLQISIFIGQYKIRTYTLSK